MRETPSGDRRLDRQGFEETMMMADIVLPDLHYLERLGAYSVGGGQPLGRGFGRRLISWP